MILQTQAHTILSLSLALVLGACAGKDGTAGATGEAGDQGAPGADSDKGAVGPEGPTGATGDDGPAGDAGADGRDARCANRPPIKVSSITKNLEVAFPHESTVFTIAFAAPEDNVRFSFLGTYYSATASQTKLAPSPMPGDLANTFVATLAEDGDATYLVIASNGCSVTTAEVTVTTRGARLNVVNLDSTGPTIGVTPHGRIAYLQRTVQQPYGNRLELFETPPGFTLAGFFLLDARAQNLDVVDLQSGEVLATTGPFEAAPASTQLLVYQLDDHGRATAKLVTPDYAAFERDDTIRVSVVNLMETSIAATDDLHVDDYLIPDLEPGEISESFEVPLEFSLSDVDITSLLLLMDSGDETAFAMLPFEAGETGQTQPIMFPATYVTIFAFRDSDGRPRTFGHVHFTKFLELDFDFIYGQMIRRVPLVDDSQVGVMFVNAYDVDGTMGLTPSGTKDLLTISDGEQESSALPYATNFVYFAGVDPDTSAFDLYANADTNQDPVTTSDATEMAAQERWIAIAHAGTEGAPTVTMVKPDITLATATDSGTIQFVNLIDSPYEFDAWADPMKQKPLFSDLGYLDHSAITQVRLAGAGIFVYLDIDGDGGIEGQLVVPNANLIAGDRIVMVFTLDRNGGLAVQTLTVSPFVPGLPPAYGIGIQNLLIPEPGPNFVAEKFAEATIPGDTLDSLTSTITVSDTGCTLAYAEVEVEVEDDRPDSLMFELQAPGTDHFDMLGYGMGRVGFFGPVDAMSGVAVDGDWTLRVTDTYGAQPGSEGKLSFWRLRFYCATEQ